MDWLLDFTGQQFLIFTLVLARVGGLVFAGPPLGGAEVPKQVRVFLAVVLALLVTPAQWGAAVEAPSSLAGHVLAVGGELLIGYTLGFGVTILFSGVQLAGQIVGQLSGMTLADVYNPGFDADIPLFSQLFYLVALAVYLVVGGHRLLMAGLLETFIAIPPGGAGLDVSLAETLVTMIGESFSLGIRLAAPAIVAGLLASLVLGTISRTLPQLNAMALGFGLNALTTFSVLSISLGSMAWVFHDEIEPALQGIVEGLVNMNVGQVSKGPL
ncbi:MAG TPA: flagellar biosynthetic protein FliR [Pirellulales bacterium]|nr:flagellar biosynthetic protein FliR [Pirellulales bacterium]